MPTPGFDPIVNVGHAIFTSIHQANACYVSARISDLMGEGIAPPSTAECAAHMRHQVSVARLPNPRLRSGLAR